NEGDAIAYNVEVSVNVYGSNSDIIYSDIQNIGTIGPAAIVTHDFLADYTPGILSAGTYTLEYRIESIGSSAEINNGNNIAKTDFLIGNGHLLKTPGVFFGTGSAYPGADFSFANIYEMP